jgi:hypothetical protein
MQNFFEQFAGANLGRLISCLQAVRDAGLGVTKHTEVGVNKSSGHIWAWDEDWAGCVSCSLGGSVSWVYSCPECGREHFFDVYNDMSEYAKEHDGFCENCEES